MTAVCTCLFVLWWWNCLPFCAILGCVFFFFCHPHPPACWVCSLHWLLSDALGGAQVTTLTCSHLCKMPLCLLSLILSMSWIFSVFMWSSVSIFECLESKHNTSMVELGGCGRAVDMCCVPSLKLPADGEYGNINHLPSLGGLTSLDE